MIEFIIGDVIDIYDEYVIIENRGIGYKINTSLTSIKNIEKNDINQMFYIKLYIRDDSINLYGFTTKEEMSMFQKLTKVSKIGPKTALNILSTITINRLKLAIHSEDVKTLCEAPGIGKKSAERIILELKDKIEDIDEKDLKLELRDDNMSNKKSEAAEALEALGYSHYESSQAINKVYLKNMSTEELIKMGLKELSKK